ncbi:MAG: hypothetical protein CVU44_15050 [Chloroflexi bacterium HGW-Chloroflexi-6]|nr:MAG: hypothetical protein CVU44_15050 [Chloroflexi bacterium HGW-Chloroflexi-6]
MSSFSSVPMTTAPTTLDSSKHVNFSLGMVLGVDDFNQEFAYLSNRDRWLARDLIGYGTVCGLDVSSEADAEKGPSIRVTPGVALNPRGQFIRVTPAQCAFLNAWLNTEKVAKAVQEKLKSGGLTIYLTLCYRDCLTDSVPVPGEPCRTEDAADLLRPSRIKDDFNLDFRFDAPDQTEEDALRAFVAWLRLVPIAASGATLTKFLDAIRAGAENATGFFAKPPAATLAIPEDKLALYLREAFLLWTTELRGTVRGGDADCATPSTEDCVLLSEISFKVTGSEADGWAVDGSVKLDETRRPYLVHLRLLQEWLLTAGAGGPVPADAVVSEVAFGQAADAGKAEEYSRADHTHGTPPDPIPAHQADPKAHTLAGDVAGFIGETVLEKIQKNPVSAASPKDGQVLGFVKDHWEPVAPASGGGNPANTVVPETAFGQTAQPGTAATYSRADHSHGTPPDPIPAHKGDAQAHALGGDLSGFLGSALVGKIQNVPVRPTQPQAGQVLGFTAGQWGPVTPATGGVQGAFVTRPEKAGEFGIVAAGICDFDPQKPAANMLTAYHGLKIVGVSQGNFALELIFTFNDYVFDLQKTPYIVKLTPWVDRESMPFMAWVLDFDENGFTVGIGSPFNFDKSLFGRLMVEVSSFEPDGV